MNIPASNNKAYGFFGTVNTATGSVDIANKAWSLAVVTIAESTGTEPEAVRDFLDSRSGRHFADSVDAALIDQGDTLALGIERAVARWKGWKVPRHIRRAHDIPADADYLTAHVMIEASQ